MLRAIGPGATTLSNITTMVGGGVIVMSAVIVRRAGVKVFSGEVGPPPPEDA